jgi:predicted NUDIX family NTP pyrophosphohydrolase
MATAAPRKRVGVRRLGERLQKGMRVLAQWEEGCDLDMPEEVLLQPHLEVEWPDHDCALQKVSCVSFLINNSVGCSKMYF